MLTRKRSQETAMIVDQCSKPPRRQRVLALITQVTHPLGMHLLGVVTALLPAISRLNNVV